MLTLAVLLMAEGIGAVALAPLVVENWLRELGIARTVRIDSRILWWCVRGLGASMLLFGVFVAVVAMVLDARSPADLDAVLSSVDANWGVWMLPVALLSILGGIGGFWGGMEAIRRLAPRPWWTWMSRGPSGRELLGHSLGGILVIIGVVAALAGTWLVLMRSLASALVPA